MAEPGQQTVRVRVPLAWVVLIFGVAVWASTLVIAVSDSRAEAPVAVSD